MLARRLLTLIYFLHQMVLDAGKLVEFDSPQELLKRDSLLRALVDESADKEALYAMAAGKTGASSA